MKNLLLCALLLLGACKKSSPASKVDNTPPPPANPQVDLPNLTAAVRAHVMSQGKVPQTLEDLVKANCIDRIPQAPAGKKYVLDAKKTGIALVDQ